MALPTSIDPRSDAYARSRGAMQRLLDELRARHEQVLGNSDDRRDERLRSRGALAPRERIDLLLDRDSPFLELGALAGRGTEDALGGGLVVGIGLVEGIECVVLADDAGRGERDPRLSVTGVTKARRAHELARRNRLPLVQLLEPRDTDRFDPDGPRLPDRATFTELAALEAAGVPTITVVFGPAPATPMADLSEHTIAVDPTADRGWADELATDDIDGVRLARQGVRNLNWPPPARPMRAITAPLLDADELLGIPTAAAADAVDAREVIWRIVDGSDLDEFKPYTGRGLVTGWAALCGHLVGIVASNGPVEHDESAKGAQFVRRCSDRDIPVVFLDHRHGFPSGSELVRAVAGSAVPHLTVLIDPAAEADDTMATGAYDPRFVFRWPNEELSPERRGADGPPDHRRWEDAVIDPRDTRVVLGIALSCIHADS